MNTDIQDKLIDIIAKEAQLDRALLSPESTMDSFGVPSLTQLEVLFAIEDAFGVDLADKPEDMTLAGLGRQVQELIAARQEE
jgi:acyl carrier protein